MGERVKIKREYSRLPGHRVESRHNFTVRKVDFDDPVFTHEASYSRGSIPCLCLSFFSFPKIPPNSAPRRQRHTDTEGAPPIPPSLLQTRLRRPGVLPKPIWAKWWHQRPTVSAFAELTLIFTAVHWGRSNQAGFTMSLELLPSSGLFERSLTISIHFWFILHFSWS